MDSQYRQRELLGTVKHHAYEVVRLDALVDKQVSQRIRLLVHLMVGKLTIGVADSQCIWRLLGLTDKQLCKGLIEINVHKLADG